MQPKLGSRVRLTKGMAVGDVRDGVLRFRDGGYYLIEVMIGDKPVLAERLENEFEVLN